MEENKVKEGQVSSCCNAKVDLIFEKDVYDEPGIYFCSKCDRPCSVIQSFD